MLDFDDSLESITNTTTINAYRRRSSANQSKTPTKAKKVIASSLDPITIGAKRPHADDIKIIGGCGYDLRQPIPIKYPQVRERFLNARRNFWTPNDISMGEDKLQWNTGQLKIVL